MKQYICNGCNNPITGTVWAEYIQTRAKPESARYTSHTAATGRHFCADCEAVNMKEIRADRRQQRERLG